MRRISATYIFPGNRPPLKYGILSCLDDGTVMSITDTSGKLKEEQGVEYYSGVLVPGFINCHCHLELSFLKGQIPEKTGIGGFIGAINRLRNREFPNMLKAIENAEFQLFNSGTVAVGDVVNSLITLDLKRSGKMFYHTFAETYGFHPSRAERAFELACMTERKFHEYNLKASVVPHSPYSVSEQLFKKIAIKAETEDSILTIHNQESKSEELFFKSGTGSIAQHLTENLKIDISHWKPTGENSIVFALNFLPERNTLLLVHNTYTSKDDIRIIKERRSVENTFFVLCPNSNLYIENQIPPVALFKKEKLNICLGTDSLASNHRLSVLDEMVTIQLYYPEISLGELVQWACFNGARAIQSDNLYGSFDPGKKPGVNLITGVDLSNLKLTVNSKLRRLI